MYLIIDIIAWAKLWFDGYFPHGSWYNWVKSWYAHAQKHSDKILWLQYENMLADPLQQIQNIASYLGCDASNVSMMEEIVRGTTFDAMKDQANGAQHLRKGICGDWRAHFTTEIENAFKERFQHEFADSNLQFLLGDGEILTAR